MKFTSTRGIAPPVGFSDALAAGLAPDGGLYVPAALPALAAGDFADGQSFAACASHLLAPFLAGDPLEKALPAICAEAFDFPVPLRPIGAGGDLVLELFRGPTAAFKDVGARFLAGCLARLQRDQARPLTILVATSGDTGAAVAAAFHRRPGLRVVVLHPRGRVSPRQAHQLGCFGDNVASLAVEGSFDDCQALVKQALGDAQLQQSLPMSSANSISLGRLLPQMSYYAHAALAHRARHDEFLNFVIPTGNLGNAMAAMLARACGLPIGRIAMATNANPVLGEFFAGGDYAARASVATLANAMDVGAPSNFERLRWLFPQDALLRSSFEAAAIGDDQIRETIKLAWARHGEALCPHTATAFAMLPALHARHGGCWAVVATAHPAKFEGIVEPLIGQPVEVPPALAELLGRPSRHEAMPAEYPALRRWLLQ